MNDSDVANLRHRQVTARVMGREATQRKDEMARAINASHLASLDRQMLNQMMDSARLRHVPGGELLYREGPSVAHFILVISGLVRVYVTASDSRTMTVRYCRSGELLGALTLFGAHEFPASIQVIVDAELLVFDPSHVRRLAERDARIACVFINELSERVRSFITEIPGSAFTSIRQRVGRHLLDLATVSPAGDEWVANVGQQQLADAVGTSREVVVRVLRELRKERLVQTGRGRVRLLDPERLAGEWNKGS